MLPKAPGRGRACNNPSATTEALRSPLRSDDLHGCEVRRLVAAEHGHGGALPQEVLLELIEVLVVKQLPAVEEVRLAKERGSRAKLTHNDQIRQTDQIRQIVKGATFKGYSKKKWPDDAIAMGYAANKLQWQRNGPYSLACIASVKIRSFSSTDKEIASPVFSSMATNSSRVS